MFGFLLLFDANRFNDAAAQCAASRRYHPYSQTETQGQTAEAASRWAKTRPKGQKWSAAGRTGCLVLRRRTIPCCAGKGRQPSAEQTARTDCSACHGPRGGLREPLPRHQIRQPRHAATGKRAADAERKQRRAYGKLLLFRHKNAPPCTTVCRKAREKVPEAEITF